MPYHCFSKLSKSPKQEKTEIVSQPGGAQVSVTGVLDGVLGQKKDITEKLRQFK